MSKAIYGLAMPFNNSYVDYVTLAKQFEIERTNKESVQLDKLIGLTIEHDYSKELGRTGKNLNVQVTDKGVFFRLVPDTDQGREIYKGVKKRSIRHCSISYAVKEKNRDHEVENKLRNLSKFMGWDDNFIVFNYSKILVYELSIGNNPANKDTFCTTNKNDPRLKGVKWDE